MKNILLATTALVATAGVAAADVTVSGDGRMGVILTDHDANTATSNVAQFTSRLRIKFTASGETDGGLSFGGSVRNDQVGTGNTANSDSSVFISGGFGKLSMGDVDSAANAAVGHVSGVGLTGLGDMNELGGFVGQTDSSVLYEYSTGGLTFYASASQREVATTAYSAAVKYTSGAYTVALGHESADTSGTKTTMTSVRAEASFGDATVKLVAKDHNVNDTEVAVSVDYAIGATTVTAFYADFGNVINYTAYGLGASYDLGGGASLKGGVAKRSDLDTVADFGLSFSF